MTIIKFLFISDCFESRILGEGEFQLEGPGEESDSGKQETGTRERSTCTAAESSTKMIRRFYIENETTSLQQQQQLQQRHLEWSRFFSQHNFTKIL